MPTTQELLNLLHQGPVQVRFTKTDGTKRVMLCTLVDSYLPARETEEMYLRNGSTYRI